MNEIKWGFIGCGDVTEVKSGPAFNKIANSGIIAVMRRNGELAEDYAKRHGVPKWYDKSDKLINDPEINAIYIATPPSSHAEYTIRAAEAGKPVYVEKPMAANYEECRSMIKVCEQNRVPLFVAYYRRGLPLFIRVKELVDSSEIGSIQAVNMNLFLQPREEDSDKENLPWRVKPEIAGAGYFYDLASHQFDFLDYLLGPVRNVSGSKSNINGLYNAEDTVSASFEFESGIQGSGLWSFASGFHEDTIELIGSKGMISFSTFDKNPIIIKTDKGEKSINCEWPQHVHQPLLTTVIAELRGEGACPSHGIDAARTNWVLDNVLGKL